MTSVPARILGLLRDSKLNPVVPDEAILQVIGVASIGALKVHVTALRAQGHVIERVYKTGYRLGPSKGNGSNGPLRGMTVVKGEENAE